ncbi:MAG TPA: beta-ketoacyl-ACP synthase III [Longimicrobiales bacterium]|nr:beta-ketoacyl-ACP synthase III [Longimicrobiales bacterium]
MSTPTPLVEIVSTGRYLPERELTNDDLREFVETSDEWIRTRTGIVTRRLAREDELAAEMAAESSKIALERAGVEPGEVDAIIMSTATPDRLLPSTACDLQALIGADRAMAFDVQAACSGWLYAMSMGEGYLAAGRADTVLVVASEKMSAILDWTDRTTCVLFGDGSGAAVLRRSDGSKGILSSFHASDGRLAELLWRKSGGAKVPLTPERVAQREHLMLMSGREIFKSAVRSMAQACDEALERAGLTGDDIDLMIPHQANIRIIESTAKYAGIPMEKVYVNVDRYGNMSSASIPIALDEALEDGTIQPGMKVLSATFGAGLTWGAMVWQF